MVIGFHGKDTAARAPRGSGTPPEALTIGYAGALLPHKGPHLLLEAVRRLGWRRARVRLAGPGGGGAYGRRMRRLAAGLNVEFVGTIPADRMPGFLRGLDILAVTSLWPENLPFVVLEAQASGVAVVAPSLPGVRDQVPDPQALFEPGSLDGLASALDHVREHPESSRRAAVCTLDEMTAATESVYREALARHGRP